MQSRSESNFDRQVGRVLTTLLIVGLGAVLSVVVFGAAVWSLATKVTAAIAGR